MSERFHLGYRPALDGLRGISILAVMFHHLQLPIRGGFLGVDVFFVLSGFLITCLLVEEVETTGKIHLPNFYARRALRLLPALATMLALSVPFVTVSQLAPAVAYYANWAMAGGAYLGAVAHTWSLSLEEQFYLLWPPSFMVLSQRLRPSHLIAITVVLIGLVAGYRIASFERGVALVRLTYASDMRADTILTGCALGLLVSYGFLRDTPVVRHVLRLASVGILPVLFFIFLLGSPRSSFFFLGGFNVVALGAALLIVQAVLFPVPLLQAILEWKPLVAVGRISYGLYLWHALLYYALDTVSLHIWAPIWLVVHVGGSFLIAAISYRYLEQPMLRLKDRFTCRLTPTPTSLACDASRR